jgi:transposase
MEKRFKKDYEKIKRSAYEYIVVQGCTQSETAELLEISEKTLSGWASKGDWRGMRKARQSAISTANNNLRCIISLLSEQRLAIEHEIHEAQHTGDKDAELELRKKANNISDDVSKLNKALKDNDKSNGITLGLYIDVMDDIFNNMRTYSKDVCMKVKCPVCGAEITLQEGLYDHTLEFQSMLIQRKTIELG